MEAARELEMPIFRMGIEKQFQRESDLRAAVEISMHMRCTVLYLPKLIFWSELEQR